MADEYADWSTSAKDVVNISLVVPSSGGPRILHTFHPTEVHAIFGNEQEVGDDEEGDDNTQIFGYQGLRINLRYNACDMRPGLQIQYSKKFKQVGETAATDLKEVLEPYLPKTAFEKPSVFDAAISNTSSWTPPGELCKTIQSGENTLEIWKGNLADPAIQQMVKRIQILVPFFIDGGTFIDLDEPPFDRWTVFFLYEKRVDFQPDVSPYVFMGYSTVYRYFYFQPLPSEPRTSKNQPIQYPANLDFELSNVEVPAFSSLPCRSRISQFIILPPFQRGGHGSYLYNTIFDFYLAETQTVEITVEDPSRDFDNLRDKNDLKRLRTYPEFTALRINSAAIPKSKGPVPRNIIDHDAIEQLRAKIKIAPRQLHRMVELQLLSQIPKSVKEPIGQANDRKKVKDPETEAKQHEFYLWKLLVKLRVFKSNKDALLQIKDLLSRIEKLVDVVKDVQHGYQTFLDKLDNIATPNGAATSSIGNGKRSSPDDEAGESADEDEPVAKKARKGKGEEL